VPIFRSDAQATVLAQLYLSPERTFRLAELGTTANVHRSTIQRELSRLTAAGMVERESAGATALYRAATDSPLYTPLRQLIEATLGVEATIREGLSRDPNIEAAAIVGSWARGEVRPESDIDVVVLGTADANVLADVQLKVEERAGREVHWLVYAVDEARSLQSAGHGFWQQIRTEPRVALVGDIDAALDASDDR
jgi:predicted nucleotidyltransferase